MGKKKKQDQRSNPWPNGFYFDLCGFSLSFLYLFVPIWTHLDRLRLIWTNLNIIVPIRTNLDIFRQILINLYSSLIPRGWVIFFRPERLGDFFCPERLGDFFRPKRLGDFFSRPERLGDFFLSREVR